MLKHVNANSVKPARVVVLGPRGFIGRYLVSHLSELGVATLPIGSDALDLTEAGAGERLAGQLKADDAIVMLSAVTPDKGRDVATLMRNLSMVRSVCDALSKTQCAHVIYISSDAVYPFATGLVSEETLAAPTDLYGCMHRTREVMFETVIKSPLAILRPTLVYGVDDSHNSYGPNRFRRQAAKDSKIVLGGEGEETRDHISVEDVARLIGLCLFRKSSGILNLATGSSISFGSLAKQVAKQFSKPVDVTFTPRTAPITHRHFNITACREAFPEFQFMALADGLAAAHAAMPDSI